MSFIEDDLDFDIEESDEDRCPHGVGFDEECEDCDMYGDDDEE